MALSSFTNLDSMFANNAKRNVKIVLLNCIVVTFSANLVVIVINSFEYL